MQCDKLNMPRDEQIIFVFYLVPDFPMLAVSAAIEVLRIANRILGCELYKWRLVSNDGGAVRASCGLSMQANGCIATERKKLFGTECPNMAIVCAEENVEKYSNKSLEAWLRECRHRRVAIGALGTATYLVAQAGLLDNKRCTIHWEKLPGFAEKFDHTLPGTSIYENDGEIWTCAGGAASFDMMLHLIEIDAGEETVAAICEHAIVERARSATERQRLPLSRRYAFLNETVIKIVEHMEHHISEPLSMQELAERVNLSRRQIERLFRAELETTPGHYYRTLRLEHAKLLLAQSTLPVVDIAIACGFISASHFSKCYREAYATSPQEARKIRSGSHKPLRTESWTSRHYTGAARVLDEAA